MIEAVIWDFGGVITSSPLQAFARFERERGLPEGFIARVNTTNYLENAWARFERGEIDHASFDKLFAEESRTLGHVVQGADVLPLLAGDLRPQMVEALRRIHARMKTGCITNNMPATGDTRARSPYRAEVMKLFHHVIESAKIGLRKPDPRIYTMMVEALQVDPRQAVYLDDLGVNLKPARALGMRTIKVIEPDDALAELEEAVGFPLR
jgi:putative hydrolase of the HAD superfamily